MTQPRTYRMVGLGEVLWDLLPAGPKFGGAPANFACLASQLRATAEMVSCVGHDKLGNRAILALKDRGVVTDGVSLIDRPTGTVEVELDDSGQPTYSISPGVAWDHIHWSEAVELIALSTDAVCFGTLGQRSEISRQTIQRFLTKTPRQALRILDVNLRAPFYDDEIILKSIELANVLKLNDEELPIIASSCGLTGSENEVVEQLASRYDLQVVALTCGSRGATLYGQGETSKQPATPTDVEDTVGAGDAFTAALAFGLLAEYDLDSINAYASKIAASVCSQAGATPEVPLELTLLPSRGRG